MEANLLSGTKHSSFGFDELKIIQLRISNTSKSLITIVSLKLTLEMKFQPKLTQTRLTD